MVICFLQNFCVTKMDMQVKIGRQVVKKCSHLASFKSETLLNRFHRLFSDVFKKRQIFGTQFSDGSDLLPWDSQQIHSRDVVLIKLPVFIKDKFIILMNISFQPFRFNRLIQNIICPNILFLIICGLNNQWQSYFLVKFVSLLY